MDYIPEIVTKLSSILSESFSAVGGIIQFPVLNPLEPVLIVNIAEYRKRNRKKLSSSHAEPDQAFK